MSDRSLCFVLLATALADSLLLYVETETCLNSCLVGAQKSKLKDILSLTPRITCVNGSRRIYRMPITCQVGVLYGSDAYAARMKPSADNTCNPNKKRICSAACMWGFAKFLNHKTTRACFTEIRSSSNLRLRWSLIRRRAAIF